MEYARWRLEEEQIGTHLRMEIRRTFPVAEEVMLVDFLSELNSSAQESDQRIPLEIRVNDQRWNRVAGLGVAELKIIITDGSHVQGIDRGRINMSGGSYVAYQLDPYKRATWLDQKQIILRTGLNAGHVRTVAELAKVDMLDFKIISEHTRIGPGKKQDK